MHGEMCRLRAGPTIARFASVSLRRSAAKLNIGKDSRAPCPRGTTDESHMEKRRFPYEEYNKWSQDPAEKRRWTEALEKWGPKRVEAELSDRALGSSARINVGETRDVIVGFIRDWLAWREKRQIDWTMWAVILGFAVGIAVIGISIFLN
jgi:hypothetical protein